MKTLNYFLLVILTLLFFQCNRKYSDYHTPKEYIHDPNTPKHLTPVVKKIVKNGELMSEAVGYAGTEPEQYRNFKLLKQKASDKDLEILTNHTDPVVRCYAFWGLSERNNSNLFDLGLEHLNDTALVHTLFGCIGSSEMVGDFMLSYLVRNLNQNNQTEKIKYLDSVLLYQDCSIGFVDAAIANVSPRDEHKYKRVREFAENGNGTAMITISRFQKESDVSLIKNYYKESSFYFMKAVQNFHHESFKTNLEDYSKKILKTRGGHSSGAWRQFYLAVASYQDDWAVSILEKPLKNVARKSLQKYYIDQVFNAVMENKAPIFDDLRYELWDKWKKANTQSVKYLIKRKKEMADEILFITFENVEDYSSVDIFSYNETPLADYLIREIYDRGSEKTIKLTEKNILESNVHNIKFFTPLISKTRDERLINAALKRLETEWNAHVYLNLLGILLELNDSKVNEQIPNIIKQNPKILEGWGGEEVKKIFEKYSIKIE